MGFFFFPVDLIALCSSYGLNVITVFRSYKILTPIDITTSPNVFLFAQLTVQPVTSHAFRRDSKNLYAWFLILSHSIYFFSPSFSLRVLLDSSVFLSYLKPENTCQWRTLVFTFHLCPLTAPSFLFNIKIVYTPDKKMPLH